MRGGVSPARLSLPRYNKSSPRAWGCFQTKSGGGERIVVFPTCVGVFPMSLTLPLLKGSLPHVRGGVSAHVAGDFTAGSSSPRAWGCFHLLHILFILGPVFPTCVGVFLGLNARTATQTSLPHVRGGVSAAGENRFTDRQSSPRAWGCFYSCQAGISLSPVFPTCVGVFPIVRNFIVAFLVFPTCVGVFP